MNKNFLIFTRNSKMKSDPKFQNEVSVVLELLLFNRRLLPYNKDLFIKMCNLINNTNFLRWNEMTKGTKKLDVGIYKDSKFSDYRSFKIQDILNTSNISSELDNLRLPLRFFPINERIRIDHGRYGISMWEKLLCASSQRHAQLLKDESRIRLFHFVLTQDRNPKGYKDYCKYGTFDSINNKIWDTTDWERY